MIKQPKRIHRAHDIGLLDDADPIDLPGGVFLDDLDVEALTSQGNGRGQAADAATDY